MGGSCLSTLPPPVGLSGSRLNNPERQTERDRERQRETQRDTEIERHRETEREIELRKLYFIITETEGGRETDRHRLRQRQTDTQTDTQRHIGPGVLSMIPMHGTWHL